jgi:hypothetical protein
MPDAQDRIRWSAFFVKLAVGGLSPLIVQTMWASHPASGFAVGACVGIIAQNLLPPRGTMRSLATLLLYGLAVSVLYALFERLR